MEKQKGGLHKRVAAIFDGLHGNEDRASGSSDMPKKEAAYKASFPGNVAVMNVPQDGNINGGGSADRPVDNNIGPKESFSTQSRPQSSVQNPETPKADKAEPRDKQNRIMLPASLTVKPNFKIIDKLKAKVATLVEQHGKKQLVYLSLIPVLAIFMVVMLWNALKSPSSPAQSIADSAVAGNMENQLLLSWAKPTLFPDNLRDPMKKYSSPQAISSTDLASDLVINGIVYMEANPAESTAIIGKRTVSIGDEVSGAIVKDIQRDHLIFEIDGKLIKRGVGR